MLLGSSVLDPGVVVLIDRKFWVDLFLKTRLVFVTM
jgi:hypothetical protein